MDDYIETALLRNRKEKRANRKALHRGRVWSNREKNAKVDRGRYYLRCSEKKYYIFKPPCSTRSLSFSSIDLSYLFLRPRRHPFVSRKAEPRWTLFSITIYSDSRTHLSLELNQTMYTQNCIFVYRCLCPGTVELQSHTCASFNVGLSNRFYLFLQRKVSTVPYFASQILATIYFFLGRRDLSCHILTLPRTFFFLDPQRSYNTQYSYNWNYFNTRKWVFLCISLVLSLYYKVQNVGSIHLGYFLSENFEYLV